MKNKGLLIAINNQVAEVSFSKEFPQIHDILVLEGNERVKLEVVSSASPTSFYCFILKNSSNLTLGSTLLNTGESLQVPVGLSVLGQAIDLFGNSIYDKKWKAKTSREVFSSSIPKLSEIVTHDQVQETGIKAIDFFAPLVKGGKMGLLGGAGLGKTMLLTELMNNIVVMKGDKDTHKGGTKEDKNISIFAAVGERSREVGDLVSDLTKSKVMDKTVVIVGQMGENPAVRFRTAYSAARLAEYFRDEQESDVLFFLDNIYRFSQAGYELSTLMKEIPSEDGYQATLPSEIGLLHEKLSSTKKANITTIEAIYIPSDDINDYVVKSLMSYLDSYVVLSRDVYQHGGYPAVDLLRSNSVALNPDMVGDDHFEAYLASKKILEAAQDLERIVSLIGENELSVEDRKIYKKANLIKEYMSQDFFVAKDQTGKDGEYVPLKETIKTITKIISS
jgi:F-type H+-transporting ATPase subunit beta